MNFQAPANSAPKEVTLNLGESYGGVYTAFLKSGRSGTPCYSVHDENMTQLLGNVPLRDVQDWQRKIVAGQSGAVFARVNSPFARP